MPVDYFAFVNERPIAGAKKDATTMKLRVVIASEDMLKDIAASTFTPPRPHPTLRILTVCRVGQVLGLTPGRSCNVSAPRVSRKWQCLARSYASLDLQNPQFQPPNRTICLLIVSTMDQLCQPHFAFLGLV